MVIKGETIMTEERAKYTTKNAHAVKSKEVISPEEAIKTIVYVQEAIINILQQKGIADRSEIMEEVRNLVKAKQ